MAKRRRTVLIVGAGALGLLLAAWSVAGLLLEAHRIPSQAMAPTINPGDRVLARSIAGGDAARGDVIIYSRAELGDAGSEYIARVVAVGGDRIADDKGHLSLNGRRAEESYLKTDGPHPGYRPSWCPTATSSSWVTTGRTRRTLASSGRYRPGTCGAASCSAGRRWRSSVGSETRPPPAGEPRVVRGRPPLG